MEQGNLNIEIKLLKEKMILTGMSKGLSAPETIQLSQMLDQLLNQLRDNFVKMV